MKKSIYTRDLLLEAVKNSSNMVGVLRYLGLNPYSIRMRDYLKSRISSFGIDLSTFLGSNHHLVPSKGKVIRKSYLEVLVYNSRARAKSGHLRRALIESGVPYICSECSSPPVWRGEKMVLEIDHIDGIWANNVKSNLRFLCPNCHSQMPTSSNTKYITVPCTRCGKEFLSKQNRKGQVRTEFCSVLCRNSNRPKCRPEARKGAWPLPDELRKLVWASPVSQVAKDIGVSGVAVGRMCRRLGIKPPPRGYWAKLASGKC
jgi:hypothetical protein